MKRLFEIDMETWLVRGIFMGADIINLHQFNLTIQNPPAGYIGRPSGLDVAVVAIHIL
jgi:hypothetical protein